MDCPVLDADTLGHELLEQGQPAREEVIGDFGQAERAIGRGEGIEDGDRPVKCCNTVGGRAPAFCIGRSAW